MKNLALIASVALVALAVLRIFFVSNLSIPVSLAVLSVADQAAVLASTVFFVAVTFVPLFALLPQSRKWLLAGNNPGAQIGTKLRTALLWSPLSVFLLAVMPLSLVAGLAMGGIISAIIGGLRRRSSASEKARKRLGGAVETLSWLWATSIGVLLMVVLSQSWMPLERISIAGAEKDVVGYVVGEQAGATLLLDREKQPMWVTTEDLANRQICERAADSWASITGMALVREATGTQLPECPEYATE